MSTETKTSPHTVTDEMLFDVMDAAMYGINYWCMFIDVGDEMERVGAEYVSEVPSKGGTLLLIQEFPDRYWNEDVRAKWWSDRSAATARALGRADCVHTLTRAKLRRGIKLAAEHHGMTVARFYDEHDGGYADDAVQFAIFGELVFA